jgi:hypothetical protein
VRPERSPRRARCGAALKKTFAILFHRAKPLPRVVRCNGYDAGRKDSGQEARREFFRGKFFLGELASGVVRRTPG